MAATKDKLSRTGNNLSAMSLNRQTLAHAAHELGMSKAMIEQILAELPGRKGERWFILADDDTDPTYWITMTNSDFKKRYEFTNGRYVFREFTKVRAL